MLIDEAVITVEGGKGGAGKVSFFPVMGAGPDGGDGGDGGNVYLRASRQMTSLEKYSSTKKFTAQNGDSGDRYRRKGKAGDDLYLTVPVGTLVREIESGEELELNNDGVALLLVEGGRGGRGNDSFKSPTNTTPKKAQPGELGEKRTFKLIMRLIADIGLIGLPNAGKSTLLNALTSADVKTAPYPFTTLTPNLGVVHGNVLADIPGLIEGASSGKGLGTRFLKHIEKVTILFHCISVESTDPLKDYETIRKEMGVYNTHLLEKREIILLTKTDLVDDNETESIIKKLTVLEKPIIPVSVLKDETTDRIKKEITNYVPSRI